MNNLPKDFNPSLYKNIYNDLNNLSENELKLHYLNYGIKENRVYKLNLPYDFNTNIYRNLNNDLKDLSNNELKLHYLNYGIKEKRKYKNFLNKSISIVMAYHNNRKEQIIRTLNQFELLYSDKYNFEVIIVDDVTEDEFKLFDIIYNYSYNINYILISKEEKGNRVNPCTAYNKGFKASKSEIMIIQNPECYHVGDIIKYTLDNMNKNDYFSYSCFSTGSDEITMELINSNNIFSKVNDLSFLSKNNIDDNFSWYNHPIHRPTNYHFCSAIYKSKLDIIGGFDEKFSDGYWYDDDDLLLSIKYILKLNIKTIPIDEVFVIHQFHKKFEKINLLDDKNIVTIKILYNKKLYEYKKKHYDIKYSI